jgi:hypothetical protein
MAYEIKRGDLLPTLKANLLDAANQPITNLNLATSIFAVFKKPDNSVLRRTCTLLDPALAKVEFVWQLGDTEPAGPWQVEFEISWPGGPQTVPSKGYVAFEVYPDLG